MNPKIGIVTVTYNSAAVLDDFLASLAVQAFTNWVLYVVDNASTDATLARMSQWQLANRSLPSETIANPDNKGVAEGNNQGIAAALHDQCTHILLLNNDTAFGTNLLQSLLDGLIENKCHMAVPKIMYYDQPDLIWCAGGYFLKLSPSWVDHYGRDQKDQTTETHSKEINYAPTCCLIAQSDIFRDIGMMDKQYFVYYDDVDFCYRAGKHSYRMFYLANLKLFHKVSQLTGGESSPFAIRYTMRNRIYFIRKNFHSPYREVSLLFNFLWMLGALVRRREMTRFRIRWNAFGEGFSLSLP